MLVILFIIYELVCALIFDNVEMKQSVLIVLVCFTTTLVIKVLLRCRELSLAEKREMSRELGRVDALRNGEFVEVGEQELTVGDIIKIHNNETVPVSGILLTND